MANETVVGLVPSLAPPDANITSTGINSTMTTWEVLQSMDFMAIEIQMIVSAILIIYLGAHASLRRPPSAAPPAVTDKTKRNKDGKPIQDDAEKEQFAPGFEASDAILFPLMAGTVLIGLYYLLQWLQDPAILNTILRWYMSITSVVSNGTLLGNAMQTLVAFVFPDQWLDGKGVIWTVDTRRRHAEAQQPDSTRATKATPLAGPASQLPLSPRRCKALFTLRHLLTEDWHMQINILGICQESIEYKLTTLVGFIMGIALQAAYLYTGNDLLSNIIGLAVCYMAFTYISVTSFGIGSAVLGGLFIYDIIMVFYTPYMVSVATQIDVPIKLVYHTSNRSSMIGLGDIVLPGIFICMALRFDLWLHYHGQQKRVPTELKTVTQVNVPSDGVNPASTKEVTSIETVYRDVKAPFVDPRGQWGNLFWTTPWHKLPAGGRGSSAEDVAAMAFPKTYFYGTLVGYLLGMLVTIGVLLVFKRGQPALLYLVPGTIGSLLVTGLWRRQLADVIRYTENGSLDVVAVVVEYDGEGKPIVPVKEEAEEEAEEDGEKDGSNVREDEQPQDYEALLFSITAPREESDPRKEE